MPESGMVATASAVSMFGNRDARGMSDKGLRWCAPWLALLARRVPASRLPISGFQPAQRSMDSLKEQSFGVFKPVGHVVIAFPNAQGARDAAQALDALHLPSDAVRSLSDEEMLAQIEIDLAHASPLASVGQEKNLVLAHRELAERGYHWLVVHAPDDVQAAQVAEIARAHGAERAQSYGNFIIEELIDPPGALPQVGESPDRGLDSA